MINDDLVASPDVVARVVGDETMLLDLATGTYFGLDAVAGRFWELLEAGSLPSAARDKLLAEYEVDAAVLDADLAALLEDLATKGLVVSR